MKFFLIYFLLCPLLCVAQKEDRVWVFGDSICIDFNNITNPVVSSISLYSHLDEDYCSISAKNGNLLFYANGSPTYIIPGLISAICNSSETIIQNGDSIFSGRSTTQGLLFIPFVNDTNKYYLFYPVINISSISNGLYYSIIDKSVNNDSGGVIAKGILVDTLDFTEKMTAVKHGNGVDWWLILHKNESKDFYKYLITSNGIDGPFIQTIGPKLTFFSQGQMKFSSDGIKLGLVSTDKKNAIFNFNRCTGLLSNYKNLGNNNAYGCSFSPNGKLFYLSTLHQSSNGLGVDSIFQYCLDSTNLYQSRLLISVLPYDSFIIGQHLLAPDGKIYIVNEFNFFPNQVYDSVNMNLTVINTPDSVGAACNIQPISFYLNGQRCLAGLPNMVNYNLGPLVGSPCDTLSCTNTVSSSSQKICVGDTLYVGSNAHYASGIFTDTLMNAGGCDSIVTTLLTVDTVTVAVSANSDTLFASATGAGITYQWINCDSSLNIAGATNQSYIATITGNYAVLSTDANSCNEQSSCVFVLVDGVEQLINDNGRLKIYPNPVNEFLVVSCPLPVNSISITDLFGSEVLHVKSEGSRRKSVIDLNEFASGVYFVKVRMYDGSVTVKKFVKD